MFFIKRPCVILHSICIHPCFLNSPQVATFRYHYRADEGGMASFPTLGNRIVSPVPLPLESVLMCCLDKEQWVSTFLSAAHGKQTSGNRNRRREMRNLNGKGGGVKETEKQRERLKTSQVCICITVSFSKLSTLVKCSEVIKYPVKALLCISAYVTSSSRKKN